AAQVGAAGLSLGPASVGLNATLILPSAQSVQPTLSRQSAVSPVQTAVAAKATPILQAPKVRVAEKTRSAAAPSTKELLNDRTLIEVKPAEVADMPAGEAHGFGQKIMDRILGLPSRRDTASSDAVQATKAWTMGRAGLSKAKPAKPLGKPDLPVARPSLLTAGVALSSLGFLASGAWMAAGFLAGAVLGARVSIESAEEGHASWARVAMGALIGGAAGLVAGAYLAEFPAWAGAALVGAGIAATSLLRHLGAEKPVDTAGEEVSASKDPLFEFHGTGSGVLMSVREDQLGVPFLMTASLEKGVGENFLYSTFPLGEQVVYFRRSGREMQLVAKNMGYRAEPGTPEARVVERSFADSVLASVPILGQEGKGGVRTWTFDMKGLFLKDHFEIGAQLGQNYSDAAPYELNEKGSLVQSVKAFPGNVEVQSELALRTEVGDVRTPTPKPENIGVTVRYSVSALPEPGYEPRAADERVGYFTTVYRDFSRLGELDALHQPYTRLINRWRLEKEDPSAAVSKVKKPVVYYIENTVPKEYRDAVRRGVLTWNKAFERIGLLGAFEVREQPDEGIDPADSRYNFIRWFAGTDADIAMGSVDTDPRTGEITRALINFSMNIVAAPYYRGLHELWGEKKDPAAHGHACRMAEETARAVADVRAREDIAPAVRQRLVEQLIESFIVHEVGHTLGLRHNFAASAFKSLDEIAQDPDGVVSQSVMDYAAVSFPSEENPNGVYVQTELGPYDYLAIEYGYKPSTGKDGLGRIAARIGEPGLEFATDEELTGMDPYVNIFDLGPEPLEFSRRSVERTRAAFREMARRTLPAGSSYSKLRREFMLGWKFFMRAVNLAVPYIGGVRFRRVRAGENAGRAPYEPISSKKQREALDFLSRSLFSDEAISLSPELLAKLGPDVRGILGADPDVPHMPYQEMVSQARLGVLRRLLDPARLARLEESRHLLAKGEKPFTVRDLLMGLERHVFSDVLGRSKDPERRNPSSMRRELQVGYVELLIELAKYTDSLAEQSESGKAPTGEATRAAHISLLRLLERFETVLKSKALRRETKEHVLFLQDRIVKEIES
ncbi:MAG: zinc-dependent metalloprotease, partial [Elusimicrobiota bacterium]